MKEIYCVKVWTRNGAEYEPCLYEMMSKAKAQDAYDAIPVSNDTPQIDLVLRTVNKYGCVVASETLLSKYRH